MALLTLLVTSTAAAQKDPVLFEYPSNLTPYTHFCLADDAPYPPVMKAADIQWARTTLRAAVKASGLPVLADSDPQCAPMRLKASETNLMLFVEVTPAVTTDLPWQLKIRVVDPHLLGANGNVYQTLLWELHQTIGPTKPKLAQDLKTSLTWLSRAWKTAHQK